MRIERVLLRVLLSLAFIIFGASVHAQTGDYVINNWIGAYPTTGGNNYASSLQTNAYPNGWWTCNSAGAPSGESNCPSDLTYTPGSNPANGGYQAFGIGHMTVPSQHTWQAICYWTWYYDANIDNYVWYQVCDYYYLGWVDAHSFGIAAARFRFSTQAVETAYGWRLLSTLALKGAASLPASSYDCNNWHSALTAPCAPGTQDAFVIPYGGGSGAGYEDKVLVQNVGCTAWPWRNDDTSDANAGCYQASNTDWYTDIPSAYRDTTKYDDAPIFVPAMGTAQPTALNEGVVYSWWRSYWAWGTHHVYGPLMHNATATYHLAYHPVCDGVTPALCQFNTDQTVIGSGVVF